jgi:hypothetical protein
MLLPGGNSSCIDALAGARAFPMAVAGAVLPLCHRIIPAPRAIATRATIRIFFFIVRQPNSGSALCRRVLSARSTDIDAAFMYTPFMKRFQVTIDRRTTSCRMFIADDRD